jgi:hypothetical protein
MSASPKKDKIKDTKTGKIPQNEHIWNDDEKEMETQS